MDEFVDWIRNREYYRDQIQFQRKISARRPETRPCEFGPEITARLADRGIDELYAHQADAIEAIRDGQNVVAVDTNGQWEESHVHDSRARTCTRS